MSIYARLLPVLMGAPKPWYLAGNIPKSNCIAAYKAVGAASLTASFINLANPGIYDLTAPVAAPTFNTADGWTFNGSTQFLQMAYTYADGRNLTYIMRFSGVVGATGFAMGYFNGAGSGLIFSPNRTGARKYYNGTVVLTAAAASANGVMAVAGNAAYLNGAGDGAITTAANTNNEANGMNVYIGANRNNAGAPFVHTYFAGKIQAVAVYSAVLVLAQVAAVTTAMNAL